MTVTLVGALLTVVMVQVGGPGRLVMDDSIAHPPERQEFHAPSGQYLLTIDAIDEWRSPRAQATLYSVANDTRTRLWQRTLPHEYGPRHVLVSNDGDVLLLDEWITVMSRYAVLLINANNRTVAQQSFTDVEKVVGIPLGPIVTDERSGLWMGGPPTLDAPARQAIVPTVARRSLRIDLRTGRLWVER